MDDQDLRLDQAWAAELEDESLEQAALPDLDPKAFYLALRRALAVAQADPEAEAA
jgi:hypothetical protein